MTGKTHGTARGTSGRTRGRDREAPCIASELPSVPYFQEMVPRGRFPRQVIEETARRGQPLRELEEAELQGKAGHWLGIQIVPGERKLVGAVASALNGIVEGY